MNGLSAPPVPATGLVVLLGHLAHLAWWFQYQTAPNRYPKERTRNG